MAAVKELFLAAALAWSAPAEAEPVDQWAGEIAQSSIRFGIPEDWIRRVMTIESGGRTMLGGSPIVSHSGAVGLMQLMPGTWRDMQKMLGLGSNPNDPHDNILAGAAYLRLMYDRFGYPGLFAAYNAGPARYSAALASARPLPSETRAYLAAITKEPGVSRNEERRLFAVRNEPRRSFDEAPLQPVAAGLFVQLTTKAE